MKKIKNGICYVEKEDILAINELSDNVLEEINWKESYSPSLEILKFKDPESVFFFQQQEFILDHDTVKDLSLDELGTYLKELANKMKKVEKAEYNFKQGYYLQSLMAYFSKKDLYDDAFSLLSFANLKKTKLNYCPSVGKTEPVKTIPVNMNGAEIFELNRNIKQKCKQNAARLGISEETASHYYR